MNNVDTGNIRHMRHRTKTKINTTQHNAEKRMDNLDTGNIRHTRYRMKTKINTTQHNTENGQSRHWQH
jgi:hypothetical protein